LRESTAIHDFDHPPKTVIGSDVSQDAETVGSLYASLPGPMIHTSLEVAELVKYADNCFHALKITFANEIGAIANAMNVNGREVMDIFCQDQKLNLSPAYLKPGFAYGGSCLPKDLRALTRLAATKDVPVPMLSAIAVSNDQQIRSALQAITQQGRKRVGILGFAFKGGTDDLRESPVVTLIEQLIGKGYEIKLYDGHVSLARLVGANRRYIEQHIPHLARLMVESIDEVISNSELLVIGNQNPEFTAALARLQPEQWVLDLRPAERSVKTPARYQRISG
ncbi:MAG TPA: nucleotide sugar dehydrogenase, partial [Roseimicrobium sp.]|nr:nucleotide sugar dehydrogenase [Roseimicrobium sp.]